MGWAVCTPTDGYPLNGYEGDDSNPSGGGGEFLMEPDDF